MKGSKFKDLKTRPQFLAFQPLAPQLSTFPQPKRASNKGCRKRKKNCHNYDKIGQRSLKGSTPTIGVNMLEPGISN